MPAKFDGERGKVANKLLTRYLWVNQGALCCRLIVAETRVNNLATVVEDVDNERKRQNLMVKQWLSVGHANAALGLGSAWEKIEWGQLKRERHNNRMMRHVALLRWREGEVYFPDQLFHVGINDFRDHVPDIQAVLVQNPFTDIDRFLRLVTVPVKIVVQVLFHDIILDVHRLCVVDIVCK